MKFRLLHTFLITLGLTFITNGQTTGTAIPPEIERIISQHTRQRADAITTIDRAAVKALEALQAQYTQRAILDGALKAKAKIEELNKEIESLTPLATPPLGARGAVYTDKHEGQAGWTQFIKDNVYQFNVTEVSNRATVTVLLDPPTLSSDGEFRLKRGDETNVIGTWSKKTVESGRIQFNASKWINKPGKYSIEVHYKGGDHGLHTTSISIDTRAQ